MKRTGVAFSALIIAGAIACQRDNAIDRKLDQISQRLAAIEAKLGAAPTAGAAARGAQPSQARPNPSHVYAVPVASSASVGPPHAKVTIVEAFTFT